MTTKAHIRAALLQTAHDAHARISRLPDASKVGHEMKVRVIRTLRKFNLLEGLSTADADTVVYLMLFAAELLHEELVNNMIQRTPEDLTPAQSKELLEFIATHGSNVSFLLDVRSPPLTVVYVSDAVTNKVVHRPCLSDSVFHRKVGMYECVLGLKRVKGLIK